MDEEAVSSAADATHADGDSADVPSSATGGLSKTQEDEPEWGSNFNTQSLFSFDFSNLQSILDSFIHRSRKQQEMLDQQQAMIQSLENQLSQKANVIDVEKEVKRVTEGIRSVDDSVTQLEDTLSPVIHDIKEKAKKKEEDEAKGEEGEDGDKEMPPEESEGDAAKDGEDGDNAARDESEGSAKGEASPAVGVDPAWKEEVDERFAKLSEQLQGIKEEMKQAVAEAATAEVSSTSTPDDILKAANAAKTLANSCNAEVLQVKSDMEAVRAKFTDLVDWKDKREPWCVGMEGWKVNNEPSFATLKAQIEALWEELRVVDAKATIDPHPTAEDMVMEEEEEEEEESVKASVYEETVTRLSERITELENRSLLGDELQNQALGMRLQALFISVKALSQEFDMVRDSTGVRKKSIAGVDEQDDPLESVEEKMNGDGLVDNIEKLDALEARVEMLIQDAELFKEIGASPNRMSMSPQPLRLDVSGDGDGDTVPRSPSVGPMSPDMNAMAAFGALPAGLVSEKDLNQMKVSVRDLRTGLEKVARDVRDRVDRSEHNKLFEMVRTLKEACPEKGLIEEMWRVLHKVTDDSQRCMAALATKADISALERVQQNSEDLASMSIPMVAPTTGGGGGGGNVSNQQVVNTLNSQAKVLSKVLSDLPLKADKADVKKAVDDMSSQVKKVANGLSLPHVEQAVETIKKTKAEKGYVDDAVGELRQGLKEKIDHLALSNTIKNVTTPFESRLDYFDMELGLMKRGRGATGGFGVTGGAKQDESATSSQVMEMLDLKADKKDVLKVMNILKGLVASPLERKSSDGLLSRLTFRCLSCNSAIDKVRQAPHAHAGKGVPPQAKKMKPLPQVQPNRRHLQYTGFATGEIPKKYLENLQGDVLPPTNPGSPSRPTTSHQQSGGRSRSPPKERDSPIERDPRRNVTSAPHAGMGPL